MAEQRKSKSEQTSDRMYAEVAAAFRNRDDWVLVSNRNIDGSTGFGIDSRFAGFEGSREMRRPRWRSLRDAYSYRSIGYSWIAAGRISLSVWLHKLLNTENPPQAIVHAETLSEWFPEWYAPRPTLNSVQGFVDAAGLRGTGIAARRPGVATRRALRSGQSCYYCDSEENLTLHHLVRREMGGATERENLLVVCSSCHDRIHRGEINDIELVRAVHLEGIRRKVAAVKAGWPGNWAPESCQEPDS